MREYVTEKAESAVAAIRTGVAQETQSVRGEAEERVQYLRHLTYSGESDHAIDSLFDILGAAEKTRLENDGTIPAVRMPSVEQIPKLDAWVPMNRNLWMGRDFDREPYFPFLGEHDDGKETAQEVYKKMKEAVSVDEYSGNSDDTDDYELFNTGKASASGNVCLSLTEKRTREGCRKAIARILGSSSYVSQAVWEGISEGLQLPLEKVREYGETAILEHKARDEKRKRKAKRLQLKSEIREALLNPLHDQVTSPPGQMTAEAMRFFCRTCQIFDCEQHVLGYADMVRDIRDFSLESRRKVLASNKANKCLKACAHAAETFPLWSEEELLILRETYPVFGPDPCALAITIGSKTCEQVTEMLENEEEIEQLERMGGLSNLKTALRKMESKGSKKKKKRELHDDESFEDFTPCFHPGTECTPRTCTCMQRGHRCEDTCGCAYVRYGVGRQRKGMARIPDIAKMGQGLTGTCLNAAECCACTVGDCTTSACPCWANERTCNPDLCEDCECALLPTKAGGRRCANIPLSGSRRVRTLVGQSQIHGMGLYAGVKVKRNQMVGEYIGRLLESGTADIVGLQCDARDHTFFFDLTENVVADAGVTGSKMKFMNHAPKGSERENCYFRHVTTRGDTAVALYSTRDIEVGEEMMFNYRISECVPDWMKEDTVDEGNTKSVKNKKSKKGRK